MTEWVAKGRWLNEGFRVYGYLKNSRIQICEKYWSCLDKITVETKIVSNAFQDCTDSYMK